MFWLAIVAPALTLAAFAIAWRAARRADRAWQKALQKHQGGDP